ncbi:hypothetical protein ADH70_018025 [Blautia pseudococcoides]|uniref:LPXTG-motif cell wall-anchored protein n=2 Tax=Blautia pseudococcoides TaxID=1796616 RepID=A0A1C7IFU1_9FIRM|nr:hypothetical protein A4V09_19430 [Blautia pseudococcoides]ASU30526.1 hypothetical protein ADH70_018025 [Blautia pseudococcoides]
MVGIEKGYELFSSKTLKAGGVGMKRKAAAAIAAAVLITLASAATALAAPSIVGSIDMPQVSASRGSVTLEGVVPEKYEEEVRNVIVSIDAANVDSTLNDVFAGLSLADLNIPIIRMDSQIEVEAADLKEFKFLSPVMELSIADAVPTEENPVEVTFTVNNLTDNIEVFVLHFCEKHSWELLRTEKLSDNQIKSAFHSASPVVLVYREKDAKIGVTDVRSPKTGDDGVMWAALGAVGMLGIGGVAVWKGRRNSI